MANAGTLALLAREFGIALEPLEERLADGGADALFAEMGLRLPSGFTGHAEMAAALTSGVGAAAEIPARVTALTDAIDADNVEQIVAAAAELVDRIGDLLQAVAQIGSAMDTLASSFGGLTPAERAEIQAFARALPRRLLDFLLVEYFRTKSPGALATMALIGVIDDRVEEGRPTNPLLPPFRRRAVHLDRAGDLLFDPAGHLRDLFGWGEPAFDGLELFARIKDFLERTDLPAAVITAPSQPAILEAYIFRLSVDPSTAPPGLALRLRFPATQDFERTYPLHEPWSLTIRAEARFETGLEAVLMPPLNASFRPPSGTAELDLSGGFLAERADGSPMVLLGETEGSRLEAERLEAALGFSASWDSASGEARGEPLVTAGLTGGKVVIDLSQADGFIRQILSGVRVEGNFDLAGRWQPDSGLEIEGSGGVEIAIPTHIELGPVELQTLYLVLSIAGGPKFTLEISAGLSAKLGPLLAVVDRIGAEAIVELPEDADGNLGPVDLSFGFKFPSGVGLSIDGGGFKGGGFLLFEPEQGRYAGALELEFQGIVTLKAIGLITTRLPGGESGFSLLVIISAEFNPIQLGFGFTLNGVGGLLGLNRTVKIDVLRQGIKTNALASVLFPKNIVENAPRLISDLRQIFPPQGDRFVFGPMAKIGWGTPSLLTLELGLIIEVPSPVRIAVLGIFRVILPDEKLALVRIQVNFLGAWEQDKELISFDAGLFDSRLVRFPLAGDMALRLGYGDNPNFLVTVGGFHPSYTPPPLALPELARISVNLIAGNNPRLTLEAYFAVTSNTVQVGARIELEAKAWKFRIYGFLAFDALFQFSPFRFIVGISAGVAVKAGSSTLFSIGLEFTLAGPTPWNAKGKATFKVLFVKVKVRFNKTWGEDKDTTLPDVEVLPKLVEALAAKTNWEAKLPARSHLLVSVKELEDAASDHVVAHPVGTLTVSQKVVPLETRIDKFGSRNPADANRFVIEKVTSDGTDLDKAPVEEFFAPAQFEEMDDAEKLSRRSFERMPAGAKITASGQELRSSRVLRREVKYETIIIDTRRILRLVERLAERLGTFFALLRGNALAKSRLSYVRNAPPVLGPGKIEVAQEGYTVVGVGDLKPFDGSSAYGSEAGAQAYLRDLVDGDPSLAEELQVVPNFEVNEAA